MHAACQRLPSGLGGWESRLSHSRTSGLFEFFWFLVSRVILLLLASSLFCSGLFLIVPHNAPILLLPSIASFFAFMGTE